MDFHFCEMSGAQVPAGPAAEVMCPASAYKTECTRPDVCIVAGCCADRAEQAAQPAALSSGPSEFVPSLEALRTAFEKIKFSY